MKKSGKHRKTCQKSWRLSWNSCKPPTNKHVAEGCFHYCWLQFSCDIVVWESLLRRTTEGHGQTSCRNIRRWVNTITNTCIMLELCTYLCVTSSVVTPSHSQQSPTNSWFILRHPDRLLDKLYTKEVPEDEKSLPSPDTLKGYVIIKVGYQQL